MKNSTIEHLEKIVGDKGIVTQGSEIQTYLIDQRQNYVGKAMAIVLPNSVQQVSRLVSYCHLHKISIVTQGGNTSYSGGATPDTSGQQILINLKRLNKIRNIDNVNFTITTDAGVILHNLQQAAEDRHMLLPISLGSQGSCQIGGNIATNAGGVTVLRYGNTRDCVLGIEAVMPDGRILEDLNQLRKNNTGYNLAQLFTGSEGTLGIITGAVLKTHPKPIKRMSLLLAFSEFKKLIEFFRFAKNQAGELLSCFEYMSLHSIKMIKPYLHKSTDFPLPIDHEHFALVEFSSSSTLFNLDGIIEHLIETAYDNALIEDGVIGKSEQQCLNLWAIRETIPRVEQQLGGSIKHDISLPISRIEDFLKKIGENLNSIVRNKRLSIYGHIGDGNLHFNVLNGADDRLSDFKVKYESSLSQEIYDLTAKFDGSFSAEHGIGQQKLAQMQAYKSPLAIELMRKIKFSLDPEDILNPGKLIP